MVVQSGSLVDGKMGWNDLPPSVGVSSSRCSTTRWNYRRIPRKRTKSV